MRVGLLWVSVSEASGRVDWSTQSVEQRTELPGLPGHGVCGRMLTCIALFVAAASSAAGDCSCCIGTALCSLTAKLSGGHMCSCLHVRRSLCDELPAQQD